MSSCDICHGEKGGVAGNGNIINGIVVCDYCHAEDLILDKKNEIIEAYLFLRKNNHSISDDTLDLMKNSAIEALEKKTDKQYSSVNEWFLSLPKGRQYVLKEDKWRLADAAWNEASGKYGQVDHQKKVDTDQ
jgi:hypothetical protein